MMLACFVSGLLISRSEAGERSDFIVNDDGGLMTQNNPRIAVANDQGFVIVWADRRNATSDIYLQRHDSAGMPVGSNVRINDDTNNSYQFEPAVAVDLSGLYSVAWRDYRNSTYPFEPDIYFQSFDSSFSSPTPRCAPAWSRSTRPRRRRRGRSGGGRRGRTPLP